jgi:anti-sigma regulatory factor (Ser/Thr protein kinase)
MRESCAPDPGGSASVEIPGGVGAPGRARRSVLSQLEGQIAPSTARDAALVVSELVSNSVLHANVNPGRTLTVELTKLDDRVRINVIDPGSRLEPHVLPPDPERLGGWGLRVVEELSQAWGVARNGIAGTRVWCDIPLDRSKASRALDVDAEAARISPG